VDLLLNSGARADFPIYSGWTALHYAIKQPEETIVLYLLEKGADINAVAVDGRIALYIIIELGSD
jgi:ankyrin repeat protein